MKDGKEEVREEQKMTRSPKSMVRLTGRDEETRKEQERTEVRHRLCVFKQEEIRATGTCSDGEISHAPTSGPRPQRKACRLTPPPPASATCARLRKVRPGLPGADQLQPWSVVPRPANCSRHVTALRFPCRANGRAAPLASGDEGGMRRFSSQEEQTMKRISSAKAVEPGSPNVPAPAVPPEPAAHPSLRRESRRSKSNPRKSFGDMTGADRKRAHEGRPGSRVVPAHERSWELVFGARRWRAARAAGLAEIPCDGARHDGPRVLEVQSIEESAASGTCTRWRLGGHSD